MVKGILIAYVLWKGEIKIFMIKKQEYNLKLRE